MKKFNHEKYLVDGWAGKYTVGELNEKEAKDLVCDLMDLIDKIILNSQKNRFEKIIKKHGFCA